MMKPQYTIAFLLFFFSTALFGQPGVEFKVKILAGNTSYQVLVLPNFDAANGSIAGAQVTLRVPLSGFQTGAITNHLGDWSTSPSYQDMGLGYEYLFFTPSGPIMGINFQDGVEIPLFTFENVGDCTGPMELFDNDNDPNANSTTINFINSMSILGGGLFGEAYLGNYNAIDADCDPGFDCGDGQNTIDVIDLIFNSPSACGVADGVIEIVAVASGVATYGPIQYGLRYGSPPQTFWQVNNGVFPNLAAGLTYRPFVRHLGGFCQNEIGDGFQLNAPLAAIVQGISDTSPDCGMDNGTITISAIPNQGGQLRYGIGTPPVYQVSNTFTGLAGGFHSLWVRDIVANCESKIAEYLLEDCVDVPCSNLDIEHIGNGMYQVSITAGETINAPDDITEVMRIVLKVPTGGFEIGNVTSQVTNVDFVLGSTTVAPTQSPGFDYVTIELNTPNTQDIPYFEATKTPLFTFENLGTCPGDSIYLIPMDDPYLVSGADINHEIILNGGALNDCIGEGAAECGVMPSDCDVTYEFTLNQAGEYQISVRTDNVNVSGPMAITSGTQFTIKVPTGGFQIDNLTSLLPGNPTPSFSSNLVEAAPPEDPDFDYYTIFQQSATTATSGLSYTAGQYVPFVTFKNIGPCISGDIILVDNDDPIAQQVAANNGVTLGQNITILGIGATIPACVSENFSVECQGDPCTTLSPAFQVGMICEGATIDFTNTTTSTETISSWDWDFGDGNSSAEESPSHTFSSSGNFEVSLTVTTESGCEATYSEFVTVFPSPGVPAITAYTDCGTGVEITVPSAASIVWAPEDGLTPAPPTNQATIMAHPTVTTVYNVTLTTEDGCSTSTDITVTLDDKPQWKDVTARDVTDCGLQDGQLVVTATNGAGMVEYALDPNGPWVSDTLFTGLAAGQYNVFARNATGDCPVASPWNPLTINAPIAPVITEVQVVDPTGAGGNGQITVIAMGGNGPLQYTLVGVAGPQDSNVFSNLSQGTYTVQVTNADGSCLQEQNATLTLQDIGGDLVLVSTSFQENICEGMAGTVSLTVNENIQNVTITGGPYSNDVVNGQNLIFEVQPTVGNGTYTVMITGTSGSLTEVVTVNVTAPPVASFSIASTSLCSGEPVEIHFTGTASASADFVWSLGGGQIIADDGNGNITVEWATAGSKNITLTVQDAGCEDESSDALMISDSNFDVVLTPTAPSCTGDDGAINVIVTGTSTYSFLWEDGSTASERSNLSEGTYTVTITDANAGCSQTFSETLTAPNSSISASLETIVPTGCSVSDGGINVIATGNYTYQWDGPGVAGSTSQNQSGLPAGSYSVTVTDASNCTLVLSETLVSTGGNLALTTSATDVSQCGGNVTDGEIEVALPSATGTVTYEIYRVSAPDNPVEIQMTTATSYTFTGLNADAYNVIVSDASGCSGSEVVGVGTAASTLTTTQSQTSADCTGENGTVTVNITSGTAPYNYQFFNNNNTGTDMTNNTVINVGGVSSETAVVIVTDATGCVSVNSFLIPTGEPDWLNSLDNVVIDPSCNSNNGTVVITGSPANADIVWSHDPSISGAVATNVPEGLLSVTITDQNQCEVQVDLDIVATDGPLFDITQVKDASDCNVIDGGLVFEVTSGGNFEYIVSNGAMSFTGQGSVNTPVAVPNLSGGTWEIQVVDANDDGCSATQTATVQGGLVLNETFDTTFASACGVSDGVITLNVMYGGQLNITTNQGTVASTFTNTATITGLYEGVVNIVVSDMSNNCSNEYQIDLGNMPEAQFQSDDFEKGDLVCPNDFGFIRSNLTVELEIADTLGNPIGMTPWMDATTGTYLLILASGQCQDTAKVEIDGPPPYVVEQIVVNESCVGEDGSIVLNVSGANGASTGYAYFWPNGIGNSNTVTGLSAGSYEVTIEDGMGCEHIQSIEVDGVDQANCDDCDFIFFIDTITVNVEGLATKVCLPTTLTIQQFSAYDLMLDGSPFTANIDECGEKTNFYSYSVLESYTPFQFRLEEWINSENHPANFEFNSIEELVENMNEIDPTGNWVADTTLMVIFGGSTSTQYSTMVFTHIPSGSIVSIDPGSNVVFTPSILVNDNREHVLIATDPNNPDCADTLFLNMLAPAAPTPDTIFLTLNVGEMVDTCLNVSELGNLESITNACNSFTNNAQWMANGEECITVEGLDEGSDEFCIVICDDNGLCDTTYVLVEVEDGGIGTEVHVLPGFSPNGDGVNDYFKIQNIDEHPNNEVVIFNRWGNRVYTKKQYTNNDPWRGEYNDQILPDGTYFYLLDVEMEGEMKNMKGYVQIRR